MKLIASFFGFIFLSDSIRILSAAPCFEHFDNQDHFTRTFDMCTLICYNVSSELNLDFPPFYTFTKKHYKQALNITDSNVPVLPPLAFSKFHYIKVLNLSGIKLKTIQPRAFQNLSSLHQLHLDNNELTELENDTFYNLQGLRLLNVSGNKIFKIEKWTFFNVGWNMELNLAYNRISFWEIETKGVKHLDLSGNPLEKAPDVDVPHLILSNTSLNEFSVNMKNYSTRKLDLSMNILSKFDCSILNLGVVGYLDLSTNRIQSINNCVFYNFTDLNLKNNQIRTINRTLVGAIFYYTSIYNQTLDFSYNDISVIGKDFSFELKGTKFLNLASNKITKIPQGLFTQAKYLTYLNLSSNLIESFQYGTFEVLWSLNILDISNNKLLDLNPHIFQPLITLRSLYFDNNAISSLDDTLIRYRLKKLEFVSLNHNSWDCEDLIRIIRIFKVNMVLVNRGNSFDTENHHGIACFSRGHSDNSTTTQYSFQSFQRYLQKSIDNSLLKSEMINFLNKSFENDTFFPGFETKSFEPKTSHNSSFIIIISIQIVIYSLILFILIIFYLFLRRLNITSTETVSPRLELVTD